MQKKKVKKVVADSFCVDLHKLFLHCIFTNPEHIRGEIIKHLGISDDNITLRCERTETNAEGEEISKHYTLLAYGNEYVLRFDKRVDEQKEIEIPKVVNLPKKWWQLEPKKTVVVEKKTINERRAIRWILSRVD